MAILFLPTPQGGRHPKRVREGTSVAQALREYGFPHAGARYGVEKKDGETWVQVPLSYVIAQGDELRVRLPAQASKAGDPFARLLESLLSQLPLRRKKAPR